MLFSYKAIELPPPFESQLKFQFLSLSPYFKMHNRSSISLYKFLSRYPLQTSSKPTILFSLKSLPSLSNQCDSDPISPSKPKNSHHFLHPECSIPSTHFRICPNVRQYSVETSLLSQSSILHHRSTQSFTVRAFSATMSPPSSTTNTALIFPRSNSKIRYMSIYLSRSFPRSNSSFFLGSGNALKSEVLRLGEKMFLVNAGLGTPRICMQDELAGVPINRATRFENKVGFLDPVAKESLIRGRILERLFIDIVVGESLVKEQATARFDDLVGSTDVVAGEPHLLLPRRFRQNRAWKELNKIWRTNTKVKGLVIKKRRGGFAVAIAGFLTFLPFRRSPFLRFRNRNRKSNDRFTIELINPKRSNIRVF